MTHGGYLVAGYSVMLGSLSLYALRLVRRGRALARALPPEERRWR
jgi:hypothetical protein